MFRLRATLLWLGLAALAVALGTLRVLLLQPLVGEPVAHVLGTLAACALFFALICRFVRRNVDPRAPRARTRLTALGLSWTLATMAFEFGFGHFVMGHGWARLLADYNLLAGRIWVLVLLTLYFGPRLAARVLADRNT